MMVAQQALLFDVSPRPNAPLGANPGAIGTSKRQNSQKKKSPDQTPRPRPGSAHRPSPVSTPANVSKVSNMSNVSNGLGSEIDLDKSDSEKSDSEKPNLGIDDLRKMARCVIERTDDAADHPTDVDPSAAGSTLWMSSGSTAIDALLPAAGRWRGLATAGITQYVAATGGDVVGSPAGSLALAAIARWCDPNSNEIAAAARCGLCRSGPVVVVARNDQFFPPAAVAMGIDIERIIWVRPKSRRDAVWATDQSLRCKSVSAVWSIIDERLDDGDARRIQLAAETGKTPGFLIRPPRTADRRATFAQVSFRVELMAVPADVCAAAATMEGRSRPVQWDANDPDAIYRRGKPFRTAVPNLNHPILRVTVDRCRGRVAGDSAIVQIDDAGRIVNLAPQISQLLETIRDSKPSLGDRSAAADHSANAAPSAAAMRLASQLAHTTSVGDAVDVDSGSHTNRHRSMAG